MLDRLVSGAGALTDLADRLVRRLAGGSAHDLTSHRPGSVVVAGGAIVAAVVLALAGFEATDNPTAQVLAPSTVQAATDLGRRTYTTMTGGIASYYVETYEDKNSNNVKDPDEDGREWFYFFVDPATRTGVTVRSPRTPEQMYIETVVGTLLSEPDYVVEQSLLIEEGLPGLTLDGSMLLDTTVGGTAATTIDPNGPLPAAGTIVSLSGTMSGYLEGCSADPDGNGSCDQNEIDTYQYALYDPATKNGVLVYGSVIPEFAGRTLTGMLRSDPGAVNDALTTPGLTFSDLGITVSSTYLLDDDETPTSAPLAFGGAGLLGLLGGTILLGLAGRYLVFRRSTGPLPSGARVLAPGDRIPLHVTGTLRSPVGRLHVREAVADLVRFPLVEPDPGREDAVPVGPGSGVSPTPTPTSEATQVDGWDPAAGSPRTVAAPPEPASFGDPAIPDPASVPATDLPSTLIVERRGRPEGVALGSGELRALSAGRVIPFRGARPALRATTADGSVLLSFDSEADRDRAAAELIGESRLLVLDTGDARSSS